MSVESEMDFAPMPDETAMAQLAYSRWERAEAETLAEYVGRRRTVDLAELAHQVVEEELTDTEKQVVRMRYYENRTPLEIARCLHVNKSTVSHVLANAEAHIRRCLKYVVQYQYNLRNVPFLPLAVRQAMVVSAARHGTQDAASSLRRLRKAEHLPPDKVADAVGITAERLRAIEDGNAVPDARELLRLSAFYGVSADWILKGEVPCRQH